MNSDLIRYIFINISPVIRLPLMLKIITFINIFEFILSLSLPIVSIYEAITAVPIAIWTYQY